MCLKQVRCWSEAEFCVRDQLISTHRTQIQHTHTHTHTHAHARKLAESCTFTVVQPDRTRRENNPFLFSDSLKTNMSAHVHTYHCTETNVMHFSFNLLIIKVLCMFWVLRCRFTFYRFGCVFFFQPVVCYVISKITLLLGRDIFLFTLFFVLFVHYCATNRKIAGSVPDGVIGIFHW
jgi:hypothetical protein